MTKRCKGCGDRIPSHVVVGGKKRSVNTARGYCLNCQPLRQWQKTARVGPYVCRDCGAVIPSNVVIEGKLHNVNPTRGRCLKCQPLRRRAADRLCRVCGEIIPPSMVIDGKRRDFKKRGSCLKCLPFGHPGQHPWTWRGLDMNALLTCPACEEALLPVNFDLRTSKSGKQVLANRICRACVCQKRNEARRAVKAWAVALLGGCCVECGYARNLASMDFHHVDDGKEINVADVLVYFKRRERLERELRKCLLLCRNCHSEHHYPEARIESPAHLHLMASMAFATSPAAAS